MSMKTKTGNKQQLPGIDKVLMSDSERFEYLFAKNWKKLLIGSIVLVVIIVAVFVVVRSLRKNAAVKEEALAAAEVGQLEKLITVSGDAVGISFARIRVAEEQERCKKFAEAKRLYLDVAADGKADIWWRSVARLNAARCEELAGGFSGAANIYRQTAGDAGMPMVVRIEAGYQAGRLLLKSGDRANALKVLEENIRIGSAPDMGAQLWVMQSKILAAEIRNTGVASGK